MSENSKIEWTDHTFNPFIGCAKISPGCDNCYAEHMMDTRLHRVKWGVGQPRARTSPNNWREPVRWNARHEEFFAAHGRRQRVFCASLADVFDNAAPAAWRRDLARLIEATPNLDWLLLTKRIGNAAAMLVDMFPGCTPAHVWLGATVVNQAEADRDVPKLLATPARMRFLSIEPMLGPIDLTRIDVDGHHELYPLAGTSDCLDDDGNCAPDLPVVDWVIAGGESGPGARPAHPDWFRSLRDQCTAAGVPFLFKQHGEWAPGSGDFGAGGFKTAAVALDGRVAPGGYEPSDYPPLASSADGWAFVHHAGKRAAGRLLDGIEHNAFPEESR